MLHFGRFYLDKEKDIVVDLQLHETQLSYILRTPNHSSGNLITNLAKLVCLPITYDDENFKILEGTIPSYVDGQNRTVYIMRLGNTKVANIYPDGTIERKAYIPAIAKTLMSQTKNYSLDIKKTLVKTYLRSEVKFHSDLHTHRSANLSPDILIALGIHHQIRYPYYYVKKLKLKLTDSQYQEVEKQRAIVAAEYADSGLSGKYLDRKIDDHTFMNFADLILNNIENSSYNIRKIRVSLAVRKDGQAVFTDLEKVYLYRYVFTKGSSCPDRITYNNIMSIEDPDIVEALLQMEADRKNADYQNNTLYQDKLLWTARSYAKVGVWYAEISDTALVKKSEAASTLEQIHQVMPAVTKETGVTLRFLAALRRIPLTIVKDQVNKTNYFMENLQVLHAVALDPYIAGCDFVGEEINDIRELKPVISKVVELTKEVPDFVIRIHAGENDSLPDNVLNSILCVEESLDPDQAFPSMRLGHGLYTAKLYTKKGRFLLGKLIEHQVALEFQITSNVRLNNLSEMNIHPLKQYLKNHVLCVQGTDGGALYGTDSIDEELSLERMLNLTYDELLFMRQAEEQIMTKSMISFHRKMDHFQVLCGSCPVASFYQTRIENEIDHYSDVIPGERNYDSSLELKERIAPLPEGKTPIILVGGSFNSATHITKLHDKECHLINELLAKSNPDEVFFVIGSSMTGYENYLVEKAGSTHEIFCYVPASLTLKELRRIQKYDLPVRVSIESSPMGVYKSIAFEIFKRRKSILLALDGNSAACNLIQDTKNAKYPCKRFINARSLGLRSKAESLQGYVTMWNGEDADLILAECEKFCTE